MVKVSTDTVVLHGVLMGQHCTVQVRLHWNRETQIIYENLHCSSSLSLSTKLGSGPNFQDYSSFKSSAHTVFHYNFHRIGFQ